MGLLLLFLLDSNSALEIATGGTDAVRQHRVVAFPAVLKLQRRYMMMASPVALAGSRSPSFGDSHVSLPSRLLMENGLRSIALWNKSYPDKIGIPGQTVQARHPDRVENYKPNRVNRS
jgi:hypothetical protein